MGKGLLFLFLFLFLASLIGCSKITLTEQDIYPSLEAIATKSGSLGNADADKAQRFTEEMLSSLIEGSSFKGEYAVETDTGPSYSNVRRISSDKAPSLYVVNFEEGGWMIVAGHVRDENQILAYSETGSFDQSNISNPGVQFWYDMTKEQMESVEIEETISVSRQSGGWPQTVPPWIDMNEPYYWVRLPLPYKDEIIDRGYVAPLLNTKWGQGKPWNGRTPYPSSSNYCLTGCVAVSCAQILYYLKQNKNFGIGLYDVNGSYLYSSAGGYYYINSSSISRTNFQLESNKWAQMRKRANEDGNISYVAELMFDVAEYAGMMFYPYVSGTSTVSPSIFTSYNVICDESDYDIDLVRQSLDRGIPVEISCLQTDNTGHSWVIDGYSVDERRSDRAYQWKLIPPDSLTYYDNIDYDHVFTESHKQFYHPELEENQIEHNYSYYSNNYLLMNWGWDGDGDGDHGHYSICPNWSINGYNFKYNAKILHNFRQE